MSQSPFRQEDLVARVEQLRQERATLVSELARVHAEVRSFRPWSHWRFFGGMAIPIAGVLALSFASSLAVWFMR